MPVTWYEQLVAAGRFLLTGKVKRRYAAFHHELWSFGLRTLADSCEVCTALIQEHPASATRHAEDWTN